MLVLTTIVSLVFTHAALSVFTTMIHCGMDSSVVVVRLPAAHFNMLWFIRTNKETTIEDIELRVCINNQGDIPLEIIEVLVQ